MKRFVLIIFSLCLAVALSLSASAESNKLTYAVGASASTVSANTEFQIFVEIPENTGVCYLKATVTYDSSLLTYVSASTSTSDFVGAPVEANYKASAPGKVNVILGTMSTLFADNPTIYKNTGELIALTFKVNANATAGWATINITTNAKEVVKIVNGAHDYNYIIANASKNIIISDGAAHTCTPGTPVKENEVPATCTVSGSYDLVTKCTVCGTVIKRETQKVDRLDHTKGAAVRENEVPATCSTVGSYDSIVKCTVCGLTVSTEKVVIPFTDKHTPGEPRKENVVVGDCKNPGSYDEVVECTVCHKEISRTKVTTEKGNHAASAPKIELTDSTCVNQGKLVEIYICKACGVEYDRKTTVLELADHIPTDAVEENVVKATCTKGGSHVSVVYCATCKKVLSSETVKTDPLPHSPAKAVEENRKEPVNCGANGTYDSVVYCSVCKKEISRVQQAIPAPKHTPGPEPTETTAQICTVCNALLAPAKGHTHHWVGTWSSDNTGHWYACSGCNEKKDFAEHTFANNCDADCNICGYKRTPGDHLFGNWVTVKEPTATTEGLRERVCVICGNEKITESIPATGVVTTTPPETTEEPVVTTTPPAVTTEPIPGTSESEVTTESTPGTSAPEATDPEVTTEPDVVDPGCGSAVSMGIALIAILGTALIMKKRD